MDLQLWIKRKKELKLSYDELAKMTGISRRTIVGIFKGETTAPRIDTVQAIEKALGLDEKTPSDEELSEGERALIELVSQLTDDEIKQIAQFIQFLVSQRKS